MAPVGPRWNDVSFQGEGIWFRTVSSIAAFQLCFTWRFHKSTLKLQSALQFSPAVSSRPLNPVLQDAAPTAMSARYTNITSDPSFFWPSPKGLRISLQTLRHSTIILIIHKTIASCYSVPVQR